MSASRCLLAALAALFLAGAANAEDRTQRSKIISPDGQDVCFGRTYDAAHMKAHPKQKISKILFWYGSDPISHPDENPPGDPPYENGYLATTVRGAKKPDWISARCSEGDTDRAGKLYCGMDCDRSMASLDVDDKGRLKVFNIPSDLYLDMDAEESLAKAEYARQSFGKDDDNFLLDRLPAEQCQSVFGKLDPVDEALGPPLRERLKADQPFCFGRDYDAKHMASHPDQVTTTIRVFRGPTELASWSKDGKAEKWPNGADVTVSVTTRAKSAKATQTYRCEAAGNEWTCVGVAGSGDAACSLDQRTIHLKRGAKGVMMVANPNGALPIVDLCGADGGKPTKSDDKLYRLNPMPQEACTP